MTEIFISFRGSDEPYGALLIHRALADRLGPHRLFRSSSSVRPGEDYVTALTRALHRCRTLLVVMGRHWLDPGHDGRSPLHDPADWVFREVATAFHQRKRVLPVLLSDTRLPDPLDLPARIAVLSQCQYRRVSYRQFDGDIALLASDLRDRPTLALDETETPPEPTATDWSGPTRPPSPWNISVHVEHVSVHAGDGPPSWQPRSVR